jgi:DNA-directed RNA polymerase
MRNRKKRHVVEGAIQSQDDEESPYEARSTATSVSEQTALAQSLPELPPTQWHLVNTVLEQQYFCPRHPQTSMFVKSEVLPLGQSSPL